MSPCGVSQTKKPVAVAAGPWSDIGIVKSLFETQTPSKVIMTAEIDRALTAASDVSSGLAAATTASGLWVQPTGSSVSSAGRQTSTVFAAARRYGESFIPGADAHAIT